MTDLPSPVDRLARSREHLRAALRQASGIGAEESDPPSNEQDSAWRQGLHSLPGGEAVAEAVGAWWAKHPMRIAVEVLAEALQSLLRPVAQRHPVGLVLGAMLTGALLAWGRPWRWILTPTLLATLLPQLFAKVTAKVTSAGWLSVLATVASLAARQTSAPPSSPRTDPRNSPSHRPPTAP
ncbi:hypothetical protein [Ideonella sp. A 288]|uniref:hypothetical protein n=1 Tax=Ideonella sp. A 288 TaxID=1962181 RepID=UPI000B4B4619|nr:hypothetical protein [Ideonella sp. A 288]